MQSQKNIFLNGLTKNIEKCLNEADLFVFPSLYEGFPNALLEAMSYHVLQVIAQGTMILLSII